MKFLSNRITAIRNGEQVQLPEVIFPLEKGVNKIAIIILHKLRGEGYIRGFSLISFECKPKCKFKTKKSNNTEIKLIIFPKYDGTGQGRLQSIYNVSTSGRRISLKVRALWQSQSTSGIYLLSIIQGLLIDIEARCQNVGGVTLVCVK